MSEKRLALVGAHPDDCDILGAGLAVRYRALGWKVMFVSMANGDCGHQSMSRADLAARRKAETEAVANLLDIDYVVMDVPDCEVMPTLEQRWNLLRVLRRFAPDLVVTHHALDYHPDHRYTSQLVGDVSYLLKVPHCCPDVPALRKNTIQAFFYAARQTGRVDDFSVAVPIDEQWDKKLAAMACHDSQMFEWLPWVDFRDMDAIPPAEDVAGRLAYVSDWRRPAFARLAEMYRDRLPAGTQLAEVYYPAPYPTSLNAENAKELFPFGC
jgi:LmbE family N-acetylglucosaminyl deacetylase